MALPTLNVTPKAIRWLNTLLGRLRPDEIISEVVIAKSETQNSNNTAVISLMGTSNSMASRLSCPAKAF